MKNSAQVDRAGSALQNNRGFTLLEIIAVLLLIGILTAIVVNRSMDSNSAELVAEMEIIKGHLRFAQTRAMNSDQSWGINFSGTSYTLEENGAASAIALPGQAASAYTLAKATAGSSVNPVVFNEWGNPGPGAITVTVTIGTASQSFSITPVTGFIP